VYVLQCIISFFPHLVVAGAIFRDPELFDDPDSFEPERYMKTEFGTKSEVQGRDFRDTLVFGSGRVHSSVLWVWCT
jgi:cytochrome P450